MKNKKSIRELYRLIQEDFSREIAKTNKYKNASEKAYDLYNQIKNTMTDEEYDLFADFVDSYTDQMVIEIEEYFVKGFSMANKLRDDSLK